MPPIKGYKGFSPALKCKDFQYEVGKEYECEKAKACETGFHFCENPINIFKYYRPHNSIFHSVEGGGTIDRHKEDTKIACTHIKIGVKLSLSEIIKASVDFVINKTRGSNNYANGNYSSAAANGNSSSAAANGNESIACGLGYASKAKGNLGCWLVVAERDDNKKIKTVKTVKVDGKKIKKDTFYTIKKGEFVLAD